MALMTGDPGTAATAIKEGGSTQPLTFISSSKTESNKLLDVLDRTFRFLFLVEVFTGVMVVLVFAAFTRLFVPITGTFAFFTGDLVSFTFTAELLSLAPPTFHLALLLVFLCEEVVAGLRLGSLEELEVKEVSCLLFELELLLPVEPDSCR
jgi:prepilin signal peptidase PulO-like enzyme (type II secretory pathway)